MKLVGISTLTILDLLEFSSSSKVKEVFYSALLQEKGLAALKTRLVYLNTNPEVR
jgi:hypothetical protein